MVEARAYTDARTHARIGSLCSQTMTFMFENASSDRISDFELKLMDIDSEHLEVTAGSAAKGTYLVSVQLAPTAGSKSSNLLPLVVTP